MRALVSSQGYFLFLLCQPPVLNKILCLKRNREFSFVTMPYIVAGMESAHLRRQVLE